MRIVFQKNDSKEVEVIEALEIADAIKLLDMKDKDYKAFSEGFKTPDINDLAFFMFGQLCIAVIEVVEVTAEVKEAKRYVMAKPKEVKKKPDFTHYSNFIASEISYTTPIYASRIREAINLYDTQQLRRR